MTYSALKHINKRRTEIKKIVKVKQHTADYRDLHSLFHLYSVLLSIEMHCGRVAFACGLLGIQSTLV